MPALTHQYRTLFADLRLYPLTFLPDASYPSICAFIEGIDVGNQGGVLDGFQEWLTIRFDGLSNIAWPGQVLRSVVPEAENVRLSDLTAEQDEHATAMLFDLLDAFMGEVEGDYSRQRLWFEWAEWLRSRSWFDPEVHFRRG